LEIDEDTHTHVHIHTSRTQMCTQLNKHVHTHARTHIYYLSSNATHILIIRYLHYPTVF